MSAKRNAIEEILKKEGAYVNDPKDAGGETNFGITRATARANGYLAPMKSLTKQRAIEIYEKAYWDKMRLDSVEKYSEALAKELMDIGVNMGIARAGFFLQESLNVLNNEEKYYADIAEDGQIGRQTLSALNVFIKRRGELGLLVLYEMIRIQKGAFYITLAQRRKKDEAFIFGWIANRVIG